MAVTFRAPAHRQARLRGKTVQIGKDQDGKLVMKADDASEAQLKRWPK
jgi:hypothetical protein